MNGNEVNARLTANVEAVCRHLLPNGKVVKNEWVTGDVTDAPGQSLRICLSGTKAGWWADFADQERYRGHNLLSLWMAVRNCPFIDALKEAKEFLGIRDDGWQRAEGRKFAKKTAAPFVRLEDEFVPLDKNGPVYAWLQSRMISDKAIDAYRVGQSKNAKHVVFPSYEGNTIKSLKFRNISDKKEMFVLPKGASKLLFGMQAIWPEQTEIFITEGELDAMSMYDYGFPAVSVPFGAKWEGSDGSNPNSEWIQNCYDWLEKFVAVVLCLDCDEPGQKATHAIIPRMGRTRCMIATFPDGHKDANDCKNAGVSDRDFARALMAAKNLDPKELKKPSEFSEEVWEKFYPEDGKEPGDEPPWALPFRFRDAEVTVWQGYTKHGKTACLQYCLCHFAAIGRKCCVASLEIPARHTLQNMMRQIIGKRKPDDEAEFAAAMEWLDSRFWIYDHVGTVTPLDLLDVFGYAAKKYGVNHFVIDSLMRMDVDEEDNTAQKNFLNQLCEFAKEFNVHVHLVAHSKKPDVRHPEEKHWPNKYSVRGSAHLVDLAHNTVCVWRNKEKEKNVLAAEQLDNPLRDEKLYELSLDNDALFVVQAQRGGDGDEPIKQLWFDHHHSWQFRDEASRSIRKFMEV